MKTFTPAITLFIKNFFSFFNVKPSKLSLMALFALSSSLLTLSAQTPVFFGMTYEGGTNVLGNVFKYLPNTNIYSDKVNFTGTTGSYPGNHPQFCSMMQATDGNLYGMTTTGGASGNGNIFKFDPTTNIYTDLVDFTGTTGSYVGSQPMGSLIQATDGNLYGMTPFGGVNGYGNIFSYNTISSTFTNLMDFTGNAGAYPGAFPYGSLMQATDGNLYSMTQTAAANGKGNMFSYNYTTSTFTDLVDFTGTTGVYPGANADGSLIQATDGNLYAMTQNGGTNGFGNIFSYNTVTTAFTDLVDFTGTTGSYIGQYPFGSFMQATDGNLYGMTGAGSGNIFSYNPTTTTYSNLINFTGNSGPYYGQTVYGNLIQASDGDLYGMTAFGGTSYYGNIFKYNFTTTAFTNKLNFLNGNNGAEPFGTLLEYSPPPCNLTATANTTSDVSCYGGNNGSATAVPGGGLAPLLYSWSDANSQKTIAASGLSAGTYTVTVSDDNGCTATASATITQPTGLLISANTTANVICYGGNDGRASSTMSGGTAPYTYLWTGGGTNTTISGLSSGTYTLTVTDNNSCTTATTITITEPNPLSATAYLTANENCNGGNNGSVSSSVSGGTTPYTYAWSGGGTSSNYTGLTAGTYSLTVTDNRGCSSSSSVGIWEPLLLSAQISNTNILCNAGHDGYALASGSGGVLPYTYLWNNGKTTISISGLYAGNYTVTITDYNNCTANTIVTINQPAPITVNRYLKNDDGTCKGVAAVTVSGGTKPYTYFWASGSQTTDTIKGQCAGEYCCTVSDSNNCWQFVCITIKSTVGIENINAQAEDMKVYPNPSSGIFTIESSIVSGQSSVEIYNVLGEKVYSQFIIHSSSFIVDLRSKSAGVYFYRVLKDDGSVLGSGKLIIQK